MTRYEELINKRTEEYPWKFMYGFLDPENGTPKQVILDAVFSDFRRPLDSNCRRALKEYYTYDENGVHKRTDLGTLPVLDMPCAEYDTLPNARGVYFLGMIGTNPNGKSYYLVKIGSSDNIRTRVRQYATYNPMIYIYEKQEAQEYEDLINGAVNAGHLKQLGLTYLRESDKKLTGTITYQTKEREDITKQWEDITQTNEETAHFSMALEGDFLRNHSWIVYIYFMDGKIHVLTVTDIGMKAWVEGSTDTHNVYNW